MLFIISEVAVSVSLYSNPGEVWNHYPNDHNHREPSQPLENGFTPVEVRKIHEFAMLSRKKLVES